LAVLSKNSCCYAQIKDFNYGVCTDYRGETFRKDLLRIKELRSLFAESVNILALTATATTTLRQDVSKLIGLKNEIVISVTPCKDNIRFATTSSTKMEDILEPVANKLMKETIHCTRMIIYCRTYDTCGDAYI